MIQHIPSLERLTHELNRLPGVGPKSALRLAFHILRSPNEYAQNLAKAATLVKERVHECHLCFSYTEEAEVCHYCRAPHRSDDLICVVEDPFDISGLESSGAFNGRYHVLHGAIAPLEGITPADLRIQPLLDRIDEDQKDQNQIKEVILALDADLEGDTTALYLAKQLHKRNIKVSRIAHGVPIGGDIDYIDDRTLGRALQNRIEL